MNYKAYFRHKYYQHLLDRLIVKSSKVVLELTMAKVRVGYKMFFQLFVEHIFLP